MDEIAQLKSDLLDAEAAMRAAERREAFAAHDRATLKTYIGDIGYILEYARAMALGDGSKDMVEAISEAIRLRKELTK